MIEDGEVKFIGTWAELPSRFYPMGSAVGRIAREYVLYENNRASAVPTVGVRVRRLVASQGEYLLIISPVVAYYIVFAYLPMWGSVIAFKDFGIGDTIGSAPWVGVRWFVEFFQSFYFWRLIRNTLLLNVLMLVFGFPAPILFALVINELRVRWFKRSLQRYFIKGVMIGALKG